VEVYHVRGGGYTGTLWANNHAHLIIQRRGTPGLTRTAGGGDGDAVPHLFALPDDAVGGGVHPDGILALLPIRANPDAGSDE